MKHTMVKGLLRIQAEKLEDNDILFSKLGAGVKAPTETKKRKRRKSKKRSLANSRAWETRKAKYGESGFKSGVHPLTERSIAREQGLLGQPN